MFKLEELLKNNGFLVRRIYLAFPEHDDGGFFVEFKSKNASKKKGWTRYYHRDFKALESEIGRQEILVSLQDFVNRENIKSKLSKVGGEL